MQTSLNASPLSPITTITLNTNRRVLRLTGDPPAGWVRSMKAGAQFPCEVLISSEKVSGKLDDACSFAKRHNYSDSHAECQTRMDILRRPPHTCLTKIWQNKIRENGSLSFSLVRFRKVMWRPGQPIATRLYSRNLCVCDPNVL